MCFSRIYTRVVSLVTAIIPIELKCLFPWSGMERIFHDDKEFMTVCGFCGVIEAKSLAFQKHAVVVDQYGAVNEFEGAFAVILKVADCVEGVGIVALRLDLEAQFYRFALFDFVTVWHDLHRKWIGLLHVEVVGTGSERENKSEEDCPKSEETGGSEASCADFVDDCFHDFQSLSFVDFFG